MSDNEKMDQYMALVQKRKGSEDTKGCSLCTSVKESRTVCRDCKVCSVKCTRLQNPSIVNSNYDKGTYIGPWSKWQGSLAAKIMVIGQDWGDTSYYEENKGLEENGNKTNDNLADLFRDPLHMSIGAPPTSYPVKQGNSELFFTNSILCIKEVLCKATGKPCTKHNKNLSAEIDSEWCLECIRQYLRPLIQSVIQPKIAIVLGQSAFLSTLNAFDFARYQRLSKEKTLLRIMEKVEKDPVFLTDDTRLFPVYHCGTRGVNINRRKSKGSSDKLEMHRKDWQSIRTYIDELKMSGNWL